MKNGSFILKERMLTGAKDSRWLHTLQACERWSGYIVQRASSCRRSILRLRQEAVQER